MAASAGTVSSYKPSLEFLIPCGAFLPLTFSSQRKSNNVWFRFWPGGGGEKSYKKIEINKMQFKFDFLKVSHTTNRTQIIPLPPLICVMPREVS